MFDEAPKLVDPIKKGPKHLLEMTREQKIRFLNSFHTAIVCGDGVLWMLWGPIPYSAYGISLLKKMKKRILFLAENGLRSEEEILMMLGSQGIDDIKASDIITPITTMIHYVLRVMPGKRVFSLCGQKQNETLQNAGVKVKAMAPILNLTMENMLTQIAIEDRIGAVLMDVNLNMSMSELICAQQYLEKPDCALIYGSDCQTIKLSEHLTTLGPGCFVNLLKDTSGKDPISVHSGNILNAELVDQLDIKKPSRCLYIGDSISDIEFANHCGFRSLLISGGLKKPKDLEALRPLQKPTYMLDKFMDFIDFMSSLN